MSLIICPECTHEVSAAAAACPNCGHPFVRPTVQPRVIVREMPPEKEGFPTWAFIPLGILGIVVLFIVFVFMRNGSENDAQNNLNIRVATQSPVSPPSETTSTSVRSEPPPSQIIVPPSTTSPSTVVAAPPPPSQTTITNVPSSETAAPDKSTVSLEAKVFGKTGTAQPVQKEVFYLLDKDLDSILSDAHIEDESGQGLVNAFGLSIVYPDRYDEVRKKALAEIGKHSKYKVTTDAGGKAQMKDVKPDNYYLFAITKTANGFAIWKNAVTIQPGQNALVLEPISPTQITQE